MHGYGYGRPKNRKFHTQSSPTLHPHTRDENEHKSQASHAALLSIEAPRHPSYYVSTLTEYTRYQSSGHTGIPCTTYAVREWPSSQCAITHPTMELPLKDPREKCAPVMGTECCVLIPGANILRGTRYFYSGRGATAGRERGRACLSQKGGFKFARDGEPGETCWRVVAKGWRAGCMHKGHEERATGELRESRRSIGQQPRVQGQGAATSTAVRSRSHIHTARPSALLAPPEPLLCIHWKGYKAQGTTVQAFKMD
jgi:hypothetical protein